MIRSVDVALSQLGVQEKTGHNDGVPAERYMRGDPFAWCAGFVLWCNANSDDAKLALTDADYFRMRKVSAMLESVSTRRWTVLEPRPNDIVFFGDTASDVGVHGHHVGIVTRVEGGFVHTVEGNTSNRVAERTYALSNPTIIGYARLPSA